MVSVKKFIRQNQALQVIQHSNNGMSIVKACQEVGIPRSTFYGFCKRHPDAVARFQQMEIESGMRQLALILGNQFDILEHVVQDAFADTTTPRQRLAIYRYLTKRMDDLVEILHVNSKNEGKVDEMLMGPKLVQAESRFSASEKEVALGGTGQASIYTTGS
jgi:ACT domain-containing protein